MASDAVKTYVCGGLAGVAQVVVGHPFDTVKVRLQSGSRLRDSISKNLYRGVSSPLLGITMCNAVVFTAYHNLGLVVSDNPWVAGAIAGGVASLAYCPMELFKIRRQLHVNQTTSFIFPYHGWTLTALREVPSFAAYFGVHNYLEKKGYGQIAAGGFAGMAAWIACYPQDVVKTWYQASSTTILNCITEIYKKNGVKGYFKGLTPALLRAFPANAVTFWVFENTQKSLFRESNKEIN